MALAKGRAPVRLATYIYRAVLALCLVVWSLWVLAPRPSYAQDSFEVIVSPAFEGNYVPGSWFPLHVSLANSGPTVEARIMAVLPGSTEQYVQDISMPQGARKDTTLYVPMNHTTRLIRVIVMRQDAASSGSGVPILQQDIVARPRVGERLLGIVSSQTAELNLPTRQVIGQLPFVTFDIPLQRFPERAEGLGSVTVLLLHDLPVAGLSSAQQRALLGWVDNGGHLVVGGGAINVSTIGALPPPLRLAAPGPPVQLDGEILGALMGTAGPAALPGIGLHASPEEPAAGNVAAPLWRQHSVGSGLVTQLAFDPTHSTLRSWDAAPQFWDWLLRPALPATVEAESLRATVIGHALTNAVGWLPPTLLPPAMPLLLLLVGYVLLVAPVLALVLHRADRQVWFWLLFPAVALSCAGFAFWLAQSLQTDQRIVSQVSLVEQVDADEVRVSTGLALLAPHAATVDVQLPSEALVRPLPEVGTSGSDVAGIRGVIRQLSGQLVFTVERWQLQGLVAEQQLAAAAPEAQIRVASDGIQVRAHNTLDQPIRNAVVLFGSQGVVLGDIGPGQEVVAQWPIPGASRGEPPTYPQVLSALVYGSTSLPAPGSPAATSSLSRARDALVQAALPRNRLAQPAPLLLGWLDNSPLPLDVAVQEGASRHTVLLVATPEITGSGRVSLSPGWLQTYVSGTVGSGVCVAAEQAGLLLQTTPVTVTLRAPASLAEMHTTDLVFDAGGAPFVAGSAFTTTTTAEQAVSLELFDWQQAQWTDIAATRTSTVAETTGRLVLPDAAPYTQHGMLVLRLKAQRGGCMPFAAYLTGELR